MKPVALITGITGQDGQYLSRFLLEKGYEVHGLTHRLSRMTDLENVHLHQADLLEEDNLVELLQEIKPTEVYHFAAQSHVQLSYEQPVYTANLTGLGALRMLEAVRELRKSSSIEPRFFQASSSAIFDAETSGPLTEISPWNPRSPYASAKAFAHTQVRNYRETYGMFLCNGILFNHESPFRSEQFVTRKITRAAARIKLGLQQKLSLGNLDAQRDWGYAGDYVEAMWLMLQQPEPEDFVISTGELHSVQEFVVAVFDYLDLDWQQYVEIDTNLFRPVDSQAVCGDASKAKRILNWQPKINFTQLAHMMAEHDLQFAQHESFS